MAEQYRHLTSAEQLLAQDAEPEPPAGVQMEPSSALPGLEPPPPGVEALRPLRDWDVVTSAEAPGLMPDEVDLTVLGDGSIVIDGEGSGDASPLADAVERHLRPPYRAHAVFQGGRWTVLARGIELVRLDEPGEEIELAVNGDERSLVVDGVEESRRIPALETLGADMSEGFFVRAVKIEDDLWEVEVMPL
jgi:hypothetical protein